MSTNLPTNDSTTTPEPPQNHHIYVDSFSLGDGASYEANPDLTWQLRKGKNVKSGTVEGGIVLIKLKVDGDHNEVEAERGIYPAGTEVDAIDAAIETLIVVRDSLRKLEAVA